MRGAAGEIPGGGGVQLAGPTSQHVSDIGGLQEEIGQVYRDGGHEKCINQELHYITF